MKFWIARLGRALLVLLAVSAITSQLALLLPGDPALVLLGNESTPEQRAELRTTLGLDQGFVERYVNWLRGILVGDWGTSFSSGRPVLDEIGARIPVTLQLVLSATVLSVLIAVPAAVYSANHPGSWLDKLISNTSFILMAIPSFVIGLIFILIFSVQLDLLPASGFVPFDEDPIGNITSLILPVTTLALAEAAIYTRTLRGSMIETLKQPYVDVATIRGASEHRVLWRHALRPSMPGTATLIGLNLGSALGGTLLIENLFSIPGLGRLIVTALGNRDLPLIEGSVLFSAIAIVVMSILVDLIVYAIDPRSTRDNS